MPLEDTDRDWELLGRHDPYWGVATSDQYRKTNLTDGALGEFFASGEAYVGWLFAQVRAHVDEGFAPGRALDFGCGVGRLVVPLARRCGAVVGVDVSEGMLREAGRNCESRGLTNVSLVKGDDALSGVSGDFDLIHSLIVFQHIPCGRGLVLFERLLGALREGGVGALHLTYSKASYGAGRKGVWPPEGGWLSLTTLRRRCISLLSWGRRLVGLAPYMQMNCYALNPLLHRIQEAGGRQLHVQFTDHGTCYGVLLLFRKSSPAEPYPV